MSMNDTGPTDGATRGLADAILAGLGTGAPVAATARPPALGMAGAYVIAADIRAARERGGARTVGRKIGFTNAELAAAFGAPGPIWGWVYDATFIEGDGADRAFPLAGLAEPRLEPEIALRLARAPEPGMNADALASCVNAAMPGFEVVQSVYPGWRFTAAEAVAAHGLHGALVVGASLPLDPAALAGLEVSLDRDGERVADGVGANAMGGPLAALGWLVAELDRTGAEPLRAGEVVTTGTLTGAHEVAAGETWTLRSPAMPEPLSIRFA